MKRFGLVLLVLTLVLGCKSVPPINTFMDTDVSVSDHAVLTVHKEARIYYINGQQTQTAANNSQILYLAPGEYTMMINYLSQSQSYSTSGIGVTTITTTSLSTDFISMTKDLLGGHFYYLYPDAKAGKVSFNLVDETEIKSGAAQKRINVAKKSFLSASYPSREASSLRIQKAMTSSPTPLEGTWVREILDGEMDNTVRFDFTGNAFVEKMGNDFLRRGIIEISGNSLSLTVLEAYVAGTWGAWVDQNWDNYADQLEETIKKMGKAGKAMEPYLDNLRKLAAQATTTYIYNINPEGNLQLVKDGESPMLFTKQ